MHVPRPIACTLSPLRLAGREAAWRALLAEGLVSGERRPDGVRLRLQRETEGRVRELVTLEAECCAWFHGTVTPGDVVTVDLVAAGDGVTALQAMFKPYTHP
jgi:hypothetical protein